MRVLLLATLVVVASLVLVGFRFPFGSCASSEVYVSPGINVFYVDKTSVNSRFNVTVWARNVSDLASWQVQMNYTSAILNCTRAWQPQWDSQYVFFGKTTSPNVSPNSGYIVLGDMLTPWNQSKFAGNGKLCILEFQIIAKPQKGAELSSTLDVAQSEYSTMGTYLLDSNLNKIPITKTNAYYRYIDRREPFSSFGRLFVNNSDVHVVYPSDATNKPLGCLAAMVSDWTASAFIYCLLHNATEGLDIESAFVNQTTGKPQGSLGAGVVSFGGPVVNLIVRYGENSSTTSADKAPIKWYANGSTFVFQYANGTNVPNAVLNVSNINKDKDMFVIEMFQDTDGRHLMLCYGFGWKGTYAAGKYFFTTLYPSLQSHSESWIVVKWEDTNGNGFVNTATEGDTYTMIAKDS